MFCQLFLGFDRSIDRFSGAREGHKEGIALRVYLVTVPVGEGLPQQAVVVSHQFGVVLAQLLQQFGRAFDVGKKECDRAFRQVGKWNLSRRLDVHRAPPHA
jgi:hypothetical protein